MINLNKESSVKGNGKSPNDQSGISDSLSFHTDILREREESIDDSGQVDNVYEFPEISRSDLSEDIISVKEKQGGKTGRISDKAVASSQSMGSVKNNHIWIASAVIGVICGAAVALILVFLFKGSSDNTSNTGNSSPGTGSTVQSTEMSTTEMSTTEKEQIETPITESQTLVENDAEKSGWSDEDGKMSYYGVDGKKATGLQMIDGEQYYFDVNGVMLTGWINVGNDKFFFKPNGKMAAKEWYRSYWFDADGAQDFSSVAHWVYDGNGWRFVDEKGKEAHGATFYVDEVLCTFDDNGYLVE